MYTRQLSFPFYIPIIMPSVVFLDTFVRKKKKKTNDILGYMNDIVGTVYFYDVVCGKKGIFILSWWKKKMGSNGLFSYY